MQLHFALNAPPAWTEPELVKVPLVHLTESLEQVCASVTEANNGLLPSRPTLAIGQPVAVDRRAHRGRLDPVDPDAGNARAPEGRRRRPDRHARRRPLERGRARGYADRVQARLERVMPGLAERIVGRRAYSPADLEALNCNLVGGDPYSGICSPDQFFWLRPFASGGGARGHRTPVAGLYHIGASTHPGPGLGAGSARWSPGRSRGNNCPTPRALPHLPARGSVRAPDAARAFRPSRAARATPASCRTNNNTPWLGDKAMRKSMPAWHYCWRRPWAVRGAGHRGRRPADLSRRPGKLHGRRPPPGVHFLTYGALRYDSCAATAASRWCATSRSMSTCWRHASSVAPSRCWAAAWRCTRRCRCWTDFRANGARFKSSGLGDIAVGAALAITPRRRCTICSASMSRAHGQVRRQGSVQPGQELLDHPAPGRADHTQPTG